MAKEGTVLPRVRVHRVRRLRRRGRRPGRTGRVLAEFAAGATIVLQGLHRTWQPLRGLHPPARPGPRPPRADQRVHHAGVSPAASTRTTTCTTCSCCRSRARSAGSSTSRCMSTRSPTSRGRSTRPPSPGARPPSPGDRHRAAPGRRPLPPERLDPLRRRARRHDRAPHGRHAGLHRLADLGARPGRRGCSAPPAARPHCRSASTSAIPQQLAPYAASVAAELARLLGDGAADVPELAAGARRPAGRTMPPGTRATARDGRRDRRLAPDRSVRWRDGLRRDGRRRTATVRRCACPTA